MGTSADRSAGVGEGWGPEVSSLHAVKKPSAISDTGRKTRGSFILHSSLEIDYVQVSAQVPIGAHSLPILALNRLCASIQGRKRIFSAIKKFS